MICKNYFLSTNFIGKYYKNRYTNKNFKNKNLRAYILVIIKAY